MATQTPQALLLRTCNAELRAHGGFQYPSKVGRVVEAPDWSPVAECGNGLHGLLWGEGNGELLDWSESAKWLVLQAPEKSCINLDGKVKVPRAKIVYIGDRQGATTYILNHGGVGRKIVGLDATAGDSGTATAGYKGTATAGDSGTATAGDSGTATAGSWGTATAGSWGTATAGYKGTATAGDSGTATAGYKGTATAGSGGTATAGPNGILQVRYYDNRAGRYRIAIGYVGEDGIEANVAYIVNVSGKLVKA